ncbi:DUF4440 domain-containing protein [Rhizobiales bacterium]|uniref:YybH family protein n=1 Tax=Hongsoonwoonella zoysiae TaxID=2821844 RepID=UPI001560A16A|nr:DUF4440 domain-containing protein [Hongsoonwoonella zoysiae]NRG16295.1 DUF4440 domain-containing protein [Hongsoonwoonella zoysiae]
MSFGDEIAKLSTEFTTALNSKNAGGVAALYTSDCAVMAPGAPRVDGRSGVQEVWQAAIDAGLANVALNTVEVQDFGDTATEVGTLSGSLGDTELQGKYVVIWRKTDEGWKLHRDIWNFDA